MYVVLRSHDIRYTKNYPEYRLRDEIYKKYFMNERIAQLSEFKVQIESNAHAMKQENARQYFITYVMSRFPWSEIENSKANMSLVEKYKRMMEEKYGSGKDTGATS